MSMRPQQAPGRFSVQRDSCSWEHCETSAYADSGSATILCEASFRVLSIGRDCGVIANGW